MEKRLTLDQFKKSVGTQDLELQKNYQLEFLHYFSASSDEITVVDKLE